MTVKHEPSSKPKLGKFSIGDVLYFRVINEGSGFWIFRYSIRGKRREITLGRYGKPPNGMPLVDAKLERSLAKSQVRQGINPVLEKSRNQLANIHTIDNVAEGWLSDCRKRLANPQIPDRVYSSHSRRVTAPGLHSIKPIFG